MPRPKGSKNQSNKTIPPASSSSSSRTSISSSLPSSSTQPSIPQSTINYSNNDINWIQTSFNKSNRPKKLEFNNTDDDIIPTSSSSEISGGRVIVNPAILRYLEQNRNINYSSNTYKTNEFFDKNSSININEDKDDNLFDDLLKSFTVEIDPLVLKSPLIHSNDERQITVNELIELDKLIQDDLFWDFCTCSTDFLTSARLAEWILTHQQSARLETNLTVNNISS
ncbi:unnamed protein product [Adineta steineri]|uniref:Uncharacterized protein n=1 Tax=Adineta steineri TaxID=433720 RepID=A0A814KGW3_9BILA|nr:unnamed protein product [Adineta steineri]CAF1050887.1 unnamed protein product [Adineta steineri]CAF3731836.1 unnamed protein product [Adineta steineri]CAF3925887.1 unnamed protein product [Adineta steineri]